MPFKALYFFLANLLHRAYPLVETFILTALLPVELFGRWSWAGAFYVGVLGVLHGGIPAATMRYAAIEKEHPVGVLRVALGRLLPWMIAGMGVLWALSWTVPPAVRLLVWAHLPATASTLVVETIRAYLRGQMADKRLFIWQAWNFIAGIALTALLVWHYALEGMIFVRLLQPLWTLLPVGGLLGQALRSAYKPLQGFGRFSWIALWGNLAMEATLVLPVWFLGWHGASERSIAYWRWATLFPMNLRTFLNMIVLYFYPRWAQRSLSPLTLYRKFLPLIHGISLAGVAILIAVGLFWKAFPGEAYLPARDYYWGAIVVGYIWSTEALLLPNLLSARGYIHLFSGAYLIGLAVALLGYLVAGQSLSLLLLALGIAGITVSAVSLRFSYAVSERR